ncbi:MAG: YtfJ family protein [Marinilabiliales bacterium]|nr:YtfJ family protein [Marinilabiliales bacterium]
MKTAQRIRHFSPFLTLLIALVLGILPVCLKAQTGEMTGKNFQSVTLTDANNQPKAIPFVGEKVLLIQYTDPDVKDVNDKLSDAVKARKFDSNLYQGIGIANCKDTWIPNAGIRMKARQKEKQFPGSVIMLDENHLLPTSLGMGDCDGKGVLIIVGKDKVIRFFRKIATEAESQSATQEVISILEAEIKK